MNKKKHTPGFSVPDSYFDSIENRIFEKLEQEHLPKKQGFQVPDKYFDTIEDQVMGALSSTNVFAAQKVKQQAEKNSVVTLLNRNNIAFALSIAACLAVIVTLALRNDTSTSDNLDLASVTTYIEDGYLELSTYEVTNWMEEEEFDELTPTVLTSEESIEDYLLEHIDEHNLLIE